MKKLWTVTKQSVVGWMQDNASMYAAALSFYTFFALAPLLLIAVSVAGIVFGREAVQGEVVEMLTGLVGEQAAQVIQSLLVRMQQQATAGIIGTVVGVILVFLGASGVFLQLQSALNAIWGVSAEGGVRGAVKNKILSFLLVLLAGFLLLAALLANTALTVLSTYLGNSLPFAGWVWFVLNLLISFVIVTVLFGLLFQYLPNVEIEWGDVWVGSVITTVLFTIGKWAIGWYLGSGSIASAYGAAASIVVVLLWIYYSAQIVLLGAEFTKFYASSFGSRRGLKDRRV